MMGSCEELAVRPVECESEGGGSRESGSKEADWREKGKD
jgi:hypothetical protein